MREILIPQLAFVHPLMVAGLYAIDRFSRKARHLLPHSSRSSPSARNQNTHSSVWSVATTFGMAAL